MYVYYSSAFYSSKYTCICMYICKKKKIVVFVFLIRDDSIENVFRKNMN